MLSETPERPKAHPLTRFEFLHRAPTGSRLKPTETSLAIHCHPDVAQAIANIRPGLDGVPCENNELTKREFACRVGRNYLKGEMPHPDI